MTTTRPDTPDRVNASGSTTIRVKRSCNGCGRSIGDVSDYEMQVAMGSGALPDVRVECGCVDDPPRIDDYDEEHLRAYCDVLLPDGPCSAPRRPDYSCVAGHPAPLLDQTWRRA